ncbi:MAG: type ISP restriction/modification enzyme [Planctomycetota bacterium]
MLVEYEKGWKINEIMPVNSVGIVTSRDDFVIDFDENKLKKRIVEFLDSNVSNETIKQKYKLREKEKWIIDDCRNNLKEEKTRIEEYISNCLYRPFDIRKIFYHDCIIERTRREIMYHMLEGENVCLLAKRQSKREPFSYIWCSNQMCESCVFESAYANNSVLPLYLYPESGKGKQSDMDYENWPRGKDGRVTNLSPEFVEELAEKVKLEFVSDGVGDLKKTFGPEDVFHYIYAVFHSPEYRRRYAEFLKIDFPRVPLPKSKLLFCKLCNVGEELVKLHLMEAPILEDDKKRPKFPAEGNSVVEKGYPKYVAHADRPQKGKVYINKDQYFEGVRPEVWEFHIGGYQVCEKWLKDRRQRELSYEDISHYEKIVVALGETIRLMKQIDEIIDAHGGWPITPVR